MVEAIGTGLAVAALVLFVIWRQAVLAPPAEAPASAEQTTNYNESEER